MNEMIREQFPFLNSKPSISYLDNAATTQKPETVINSITDFYSRGYGNISRGSHQFTRRTTNEYENARKTLAQFIDASSPREIIFTAGSTDGLNLIAHTLKDTLGAGEKSKEPPHILTTKLEHHSNLLPWQQLEDSGEFVLTYLPLSENLTVNLSELQKLIRTVPVAIVAISHASNVTGTIQPIRTISEMVKQKYPNAVIVTDASQTIGHVSINVEQLKTDVLVFSGHKMYGPTGIGVLYVKESLLTQLNPYHVGGGMVKTVSEHEFTPRRYPTRFEAGTPNIEGVIGLSTACEWIEKIGRDDIALYEKNLAKLTRKLLTEAQISGLNILSDPETEHTGIVSFYIEGMGSSDIANFLDDDGILVRSGHHCAQVAHRELFGVDTSVRVSFGVYNTKEDVERLLTTLQKALTLLR